VYSFRLTENQKNSYTQWFFITAVLKSEVGGGGGGVLEAGIVDSDIIVFVDRERMQRYVQEKRNYLSGQQVFRCLNPVH
jgi:hypothetical protein